jgi:hypothetical protein
MQVAAVVVLTTQITPLAVVLAAAVTAEGVATQVVLLQRLEQPIAVLEAAVEELTQITLVQTAQTAVRAL